MTALDVGGAGIGQLLGSLPGSEKAGGLAALLRGNQPGGKPEQAEGPVEGAGDVRDLSPRVQVKVMQVRLLYEATFRISQKVGGLMGQEPSRAGLNGQLAGLLAEHVEAFEPGEGGMRPIDRLAQMFTPEATAERIFNFATSWYGQWLDGREDTEENRTAFTEHIGAAVQKGFDEAQAILGVLPGSVQEGIDRTHELFFAAFGDFIANGLSESPEDLASARASGLAFNAAFGPFSNDPVALMDEVLGRLNSDGSLRVSVPPGQGVNLVA